MRTVLLDRDGVVTINRKYNVKSPAELCLIPGAANAIARLNRERVAVALCTNQPEVDEGIIRKCELDAIHHALQTMLARHDAWIDLILCCTDNFHSERRKPSPGMLFEAMRHLGAKSADTPFIGDQPSDLEAAANAHCRPILVRTGLGRLTERGSIPQYARPAAIYDDLSSFVEACCH
ncbi:MAG: HAD-IIIA family hydrolase [Proteobacteria bacterium]|nr:HAD-IIIA family hydrolase [Pseudomonadota bacterium]